MYCGSVNFVDLKDYLCLIGAIGIMVFWLKIKLDNLLTAPFSLLKTGIETVVIRSGPCNDFSFLRDF